MLWRKLRHPEHSLESCLIRGDSYTSANKGAFYSVVSDTEEKIILAIYTSQLTRHQDIGICYIYSGEEAGIGPCGVAPCSTIPLRNVAKINNCNGIAPVSRDRARISAVDQVGPNS